MVWEITIDSTVTGTLVKTIEELNGHEEAVIRLPNTKSNRTLVSSDKDVTIKYGTTTVFEGTLASISYHSDYLDCKVYNKCYLRMKKFLHTDTYATQAANVVLEGIVTLFSSSASADGAGDGSTVIDSSRSESDGYFDNMYIKITSGGASGEVKRINTWTNSTKTYAMAENFSVQITSGTTYKLFIVKPITSETGNISVRFDKATIYDAAVHVASAVTKDFWSSTNYGFNIGDRGSAQGTKTALTISRRGIDRAQQYNHVWVRGTNADGDIIYGEAKSGGWTSENDKPIVIFDRKGTDTTTLDGIAASKLEELETESSGIKTTLNIAESYDLVPGDTITINNAILNLSGSYKIWKIIKKEGIAEVEIDHTEAVLEKILSATKQYEVLSLYGICADNCQTACQDAIQTCAQSGQCESACQSTCQGNEACETGGTCQSDCQTGHRCELTCEIDCQAACQVSEACQLACQPVCQASCQDSGTCQVQCQQSVQTCAKSGQCESACQGTCESNEACETGGTCQTDCETGHRCEITCETECQAGCQTDCESESACETSGACQADCETGHRCELTCETACQAGCQISEACQLACQPTCQASCQDSGTCQVQCQASVQTCAKSGQCESACQGTCQGTGTCETTCQYEDETHSAIQDIKALWHINEESGTSVADSGPYANHSESVTGTTIIDGKFGKARSFNGSSDFIHFANSASLNITGTKLTILAWIYPDSSLQTGWIVVKNDAGTADLQYGLVMMNTGKLRMYVENTQCGESTGTVTADQWNHVAVVYDGSTVQYYIAGSNAGQDTSVPSSITGDTDKVHIGCRANTEPAHSNWFKGDIDEVIILDTDLSSSEVDAWYHAGEKVIFVCEDSCQTTCQGTQACETGGTCQTDCETGHRCETDCEAACQNANEKCGATGNCQDACQSLCQGTATCETVCQTNVQVCAIACELTCEGNEACETGGTCQVDCETGHRCELTCEINCQAGCQISEACQLACQPTCQASCQDSGTCQVQCQQSVQTCAKSGQCESACQGTCQGNEACETGGTCQVDCETGHRCELSCEINCQAACQVSEACQLACQPTCQTSCQDSGTCQVQCQQSVQTCAKSGQCESACQGTCQGTATCETTCQYEDEVHYAIQDLKALWHINEESGSDALDSGAYANHSESITGTTIIDGKFGKARSFNGSSDFIHFANSTSLDITGTKLTIIAWIYPDSALADGYIVAKNSTGATDVQYSLFMSSAGKLRMYIEDTQCSDSTGTVTADQWNHIAAVYDGSTVKYYIGGSSAGTDSSVPSSITSTSYKMHIGCRANTEPAHAYFFKGDIDEVAILDDDLSASEVDAWFHAGEKRIFICLDACQTTCQGTQACETGGTCQSACETGHNCETDCEAACQNANEKCAATGNCQDACQSTCQGSEACEGGGICQAACETGHTCETDCEHLCQNANEKCGASGNCQDACQSLCQGTATCEGICQTVVQQHIVENDFKGLWHMNEESGTAVQDSSMYENHGTASGAAVSTGKFGKCRYFDGSNDYIDCGSDSSLDGHTTVTVMAWIKRTSDAVAWARIAATPNSFSNKYCLTLGSARTKIQFVYDDGTQRRKETSGTPISTDTWHHVAGVWDGTNIKIYVDGTSESLTTPGVAGFAGTTFWIGRRQDATVPFKGDIDEVTIIGTDLSDSEVKVFANAGEIPIYICENACQSTCQGNEACETGGTCQAICETGHKCEASVQTCAKSGQCEGACQTADQSGNWPGENIILNANFEVDQDSDGYPDHWAYYAGTGSWGFYTADQQKGVRCVKVHATAANSYQIQSDAVPVHPDTKYYFEAWLRTNPAANSSGQVQLVWFTAGMGYISTNNLGPYDLTTTFVKKSLVVITPSTAKYVRIRCNNVTPSVECDALFDALYLVEQKPADEIDYAAARSMPTRKTDTKQVDSGNVGTNNTSWKKIIEIEMEEDLLTPFRVRLEYYRGGTLATCYFQMKKNGANLGSQKSTSSATLQVYTVDQTSCVKGDKFSVEAYRSGGDGSTRANGGQSLTYDIDVVRDSTINTWPD